MGGGRHSSFRRDTFPTPTLPSSADGPCPSLRIVREYEPLRGSAPRTTGGKKPPPPPPPNSSRSERCCRDRLSLPGNRKPQRLGDSPPAGAPPAEIRRDGQLIYDGTRHPLRVISSKQSIHACLCGEAGGKTASASPLSTASIPLRRSTVPGANLGCCSAAEYAVPKATLSCLCSFGYIEQEESQATGVYGVCHLPGECRKRWPSSSHLGPPGMVNDDLAGCAVRRRSLPAVGGGQAEAQLSPLLVQEIIGSEVYCKGCRGEPSEKR